MVYRVRDLRPFVRETSRTNAMYDTNVEVGVEGYEADEETPEPESEAGSVATLDDATASSSASSSESEKEGEEPGHAASSPVSVDEPNEADEETKPKRTVRKPAKYRDYVCRRSNVFESRVLELIRDAMGSGYGSCSSC